MLLLAAWFSRTQSSLCCLCLCLCPIAMASMRIILLSTISQPQNESQRKTHFRAHFIMKIYMCCVYIYMELCIDSFVVSWKSVNLKLCVIREMCVEHLVNLFLSFPFYLAHFLELYSHGRHWMTHTHSLSLPVPVFSKIDNNSSVSWTENMNLSCIFDIQHAYAHIFMLIIGEKEKKSETRAWQNVLTLEMFFVAMCALTYTRFDIRIHSV